MLCFESGDTYFSTGCGAAVPCRDQCTIAVALVTIVPKDRFACSMVLRSCTKGQYESFVTRCIERWTKISANLLADKRPADVIACSVNFQGWPRILCQCVLSMLLQLPESQVPCRSAEPFTSLMTIPLC